MMDYSSFFLFCVLFAFVGFGTTILCGFDIYKIWSDVGSFVVLVPLISLLFIRPESIDESVGVLSKAIVVFANALPGMLVGDAAGTLAAAIIKGIK